MQSKVKRLWDKKEIIMSLRELFRPKKSLKDRVKELEEQVEKLEKASYIPIKLGGNRSFFNTHEWVGVNNILQELIEKSGYELTYREEIKKKTCLKKKKIKRGK